MTYTYGLRHYHPLNLGHGRLGVLLLLVGACHLWVHVVLCRTNGGRKGERFSLKPVENGRK